MVHYMLFNDKLDKQAYSVSQELGSVMQSGMPLPWSFWVVVAANAAVGGAFLWVTPAIGQPAAARVGWSFMLIQY